MSLSLREILTEFAHTVGRAHLIEHIEALPFDSLNDEGETETEKLAKRNPLNDEEAKLLAKLKARQDAIDAAEKEDDKAADTTVKEDSDSGNA